MDTTPTFRACIQAATTAVALVLEGDDAGAGRALERALKRLGELQGALPPHARQARQAREAVERAQMARLRKRDPKRVLAAARACERALG